MDRTRLEKYADLIVQKGLNLDPGQEVFLIANPDQMDFVRMVVEKCYQASAGRVLLDLHDMPCERLDQIYRSEEALSSVEEWVLAKWQYRKDKLPALLWLDSDDPDGMNGIDQGKRARVQMARFPVIKPFREATENKHQWCIAAVPSVPWAKKVFPDLEESQAVEQLWEAILAASRANGDPVANWEKHNEELHHRSAKLNSWHFAALEYKSSNGTDFKVGLIPNGVFAGGAETDLSKRVFNPNIPSEEIFTTPRKGEAEGILVSTKPLSWQGTMIEDFSIRFEKGKAVEVKAARGQEALEKMISMDEGAPYLGECALIDYNSPINQTGILFYNTLFDENASCHMALGRGFYDCIENYSAYTPDEMKAMGVNDSMIHVDFMIGSSDMNITGITPDGKRIEIFRNGSWCF